MLYCMPRLIEVKMQLRGIECLQSVVYNDVLRFGMLHLWHVVFTLGWLRWARWKADGWLACPQDFTFKYDALEDFDN